MQLFLQIAKYFCKDIKIPSHLYQQNRQISLKRSFRLEQLSSHALYVVLCIET